MPEFGLSVLIYSPQCLQTYQPRPNPIPNRFRLMVVSSGAVPLPIEIFFGPIMESTDALFFLIYELRMARVSYFMENG